MRVECVLSVLFSAGSSSVQQHRCGQPLPGQRQRQVPPRHDHLPVPDHLPALEQHRRRRQVGLCSWTFIRRMKVNMGSSPLSLQGGEEPEREDLWPSSRGGLPGHLQVGVFCVGSVDHVAPSVVLSCLRSEEEMVKFMGLMNSSWVLDGHDVATAFNLSCFQNIVDLGGGIPNVSILPTHAGGALIYC